jgi:hypothetical protein
MPGAARARNVTPDGEVGVGAFGDGVVRWFRVEDGDILLSLFVSRKRGSDELDWICWTPSGYYAASPGGENRIGWLMNRGRDEAPDFFRFGQFRDLFFRDDIIRRVLPAASEPEAVEQANQARRERNRSFVAYPVEDVQPPKIRIIDPGQSAAFDSNEITVRYEIESPSGLPMAEVRAFVDGAAVGRDRGMVIEREEPGKEKEPEKGEKAAVEEGERGEGMTARSITIPVPAKDCRISLVAAAKVDEIASTESWPTTLSMKWTGSEKRSGGVLHLLAIGVSQYADPEILDLEFCHKDARDFCALLTGQEDLLYGQVEVTQLLQEEATRKAVIRSLMDLGKRAGPEDTAAIFIAGHGVNDGLGRYFFLPSDTSSSDLEKTAVSDLEIMMLLQGISGRRICFIDTCHSGNVFGGAREMSHDLSKVVSNLASPLSGVIVFASSTANLQSYESAKWQNGAFTKSVVSGVDGGADIIRDEEITIDELGLFITTEVKRLTEGRQVPVRQMPLGVPDFVFALPK